MAEPTTETAPVRVSVVVPVLDERATLAELVGRVERALAAEAPFELVLVDDGSTDGSRDEIRRLAALHPWITGVFLLGHSGQHAALAAGLEAARGDAVALLDADLQNDPADLPALLRTLRDGHDLVSGWRRDRHDSLGRRVASACVRTLLRWVTGVRLEDPNCGYKVLARSLVDAVNREGERRRYLAALLPLLATRPTEVPVAHHARVTGTSHYDLVRGLGLLLDFAIVFGRPFRWVGLAGAAVTVAGALGGLGYTISRLTWLEHGMPRLILALLLLLGGGMQLLMLGLLGEYVVRTYHLAEGRPLFRVDERVGSAARR